MKVKIGDLCTLKSGTSLKDNVLNDTGGIPYIKVSDMNLVGNEKYIITANSYADESIGTKMLFPKGTILFPKRGGAIGTNKKRIANRVVCADLNTMGVIPSEKIRPLFLYYYFQNIDFRTLYNGSSVPQINNTDIAPMEIELLSLDEQDEAIAVLEKIDSIIRKRKTELKKLDDLIKARFVELFVGKDYPLVALDDLSLGKGEYGAQSASIEYNPSRPRYVRITDIQDDGTLNDDVVSSANIEDDEQYKLSYGDFMFARMGATVGKTYAYKSGNQIFAGYLIRYRLNLKKIIPEYLYAYTRLEEYKNWVLLNQSGAAQPGINAKKYGSLLIPVAPLEEQRAFEDFVTQVDKSKVAVQKALEETQILFDSLMQDYFG